MDDIKLKIPDNPHNVCRLCLCEKTEMIHIPWEDWEHSDIAELYKSITYQDLKVSKMMTEYCCKDCIDTLNDTSQTLQKYKEVADYWDKYVENMITTNTTPTSSSDTIKLEIVGMDDILPVEYLEIGNFNEGAAAQQMLNKPELVEFLEMPMKSELSNTESETDCLEKIEPTLPRKKKKKSKYYKEDRDNGPYQCVQCDEVYSSIKKLTLHRKQCKLNVQFSCSVCQKLYSSATALRYHEETHIKPIELKLPCEHCEKIFDNKRYLQKHIRLVHTTTGVDVVCPQCDKTFKNQHRLNVHVQRVHTHRDDVDHECSVCQKSFASAFGLKNHMTLHERSLTDIVSCHVCQNAYRSQTLLNRHIKRQHQPAVPSQCPQCGKVFINQDRLQNHMVRHTEKKFECDICKRMFLLKKDLKEHIIIMHCNDARYTCQKCGKSFQSTFVIKHHLEKGCQVRHKPRHARLPYNESKNIIKCHLCERSYLCGKSLQKHYSSEHPGADWSSIKETICPECYRKFETVEMMQLHYKSHTSIQCSICRKRMVCEESLQRHMLTHSKKERPYSCDLCGGAFVRITHLQAHIRRMHNTERPYRCEQCDKGFVEMYELRAHARLVHSDIKPYECTFCDQKFATNSSLSMHLPVHTGEYKYGCDLCSINFLYSTQLKQHRLMHHNIGLVE